MKYLNKFDTRSDYETSASTLEIPNVAYITASTEVIYNGSTPTPPTPSQYVQFADPLVESKCATLYGDGTGCTMADLSAVTTISASDWQQTSITSFDELEYFSGLTSLPNSLFASCTALTSVVIPDSVTSIDQTAFASCNALTSITIPNTVTSIGMGAFQKCGRLASATIGNGVVQILASAFYNCGLTSVTIGNSVTTIGDAAFKQCTSLSSITFVSDTPPSLVEPDAFTNLSVTGDITVPVGSERDYSEIARNIIGPDWTVNGQPPLEPYVQFEDPLVEQKCIQLYSSDGVGCTEEDLGAVQSINASDWSGTSITSFNELGMFTGLTGISNVFEGCTDLTAVTIPSTVTAISQTFKDCTSLEGVGLDGVALENIYPNSFYGCSALQSITFPNTLALIDDDAFRGCSSLSSIEFMAETLPTTIMNGSFYGLPTTGNIIVPDGYESNFFTLATGLGANWTVNEQTPS